MKKFIKRVIEKIKSNDTLQVVLFVSVIILIAIPVFLGRGGTVISGWKTLMNQTGSEWLRMIIFSLCAVAVIYVWIRYYKKKQDGTGYRAFLWGAVIFIAIAFGKACTDKANEGVTSGNGRPGGIPAADDTRIPAEDLLPKK